MSPSISHVAPIVITLLLSVFIFRLWRFEKSLTAVLVQRRGSGSNAWDEIWVAEEDGLWDWIDERVGDPLSSRRRPPAARRHSNNREMKEAIRVTEQKLDMLKEQLHYNE